MTRTTSLWVVALVVALGVGGYAQDSEFFMRCDACVGGSDSGTASGDGAGTVGPSNSSKGFTAGVPSLSSIGLKNGKDLRLAIRVPVPPFENCNPPETCQYDAVAVTRLRLFVTAVRTPLGSPAIPAFYCSMRQGQTDQCLTHNEVRLGEQSNSPAGNERTVVYVTEVFPAGGNQVDVGESETFQLSKAQWQELNRTIGRVKEVDHDDVEFFFGLAVSAIPVDSPPIQATAVRFVPELEYLFVSVFSNK